MLTAAKATLAEAHSDVLVVAFPSMIMGIDCLGPILDVELAYYSIEREFKVESRVLQAFQEGADVIIGGVITVEASRKHHRPCVLIRSGAEGIIQAALEAKRIAEARRIEKVKSTLFQTVLDYAYEDIISIDQNNGVVIFNTVAEKITKVDGKRAKAGTCRLPCPHWNLGVFCKPAETNSVRSLAPTRKGNPGSWKSRTGAPSFSRLNKKWIFPRPPSPRSANSFQTKAAIPRDQSSSPKSALNAFITFCPQSPPTGSSLPKKKRITGGSSTNRSPPISSLWR